MKEKNSVNSRLLPTVVIGMGLVTPCAYSDFKNESSVSGGSLGDCYLRDECGLGARLPAFVSYSPSVSAQLGEQ